MIELKLKSAHRLNESGSDMLFAYLNKIVDITVLDGDKQIDFNIDVAEWHVICSFINNLIELDN